MMILKYCLQTRKNITVSQLVTYVFLCVLCIVVILSVVGAFNIPYSKYMFNNGVGQNYIYRTKSSDYDLTEISGVYLGKGYSEELTQPRTTLYCKRMATVNAYISESFENLQDTYSVENIVKYDKDRLNTEDGVLPVFVSYDLLYELEATIGDRLVLYYYRTIYAELEICGILRPSYRDFYGSSEIIVLADNSLVHRFEEDLSENPLYSVNYHNYTNQEFTDATGNIVEPYYSKVQEASRIKEYIRFDKFFTGWMTLLFGVVIISLGSYIETGFVLTRNRQSMGCLRRLGMPRKKLRLAAVIIVMMEFIIIMPIVLLFVTFWLSNVLFIYMDTWAVVVIYVAELIIALIASLISVMIRSRKDEFYTV